MDVAHIEEAERRARSTALENLQFDLNQSGALYTEARLLNDALERAHEREARLRSDVRAHLGLFWFAAGMLVQQFVAPLVPMVDPWMNLNTLFWVALLISLYGLAIVWWHVDKVYWEIVRLKTHLSNNKTSTAINHEKLKDFLHDNHLRNNPDAGAA